MGKGRFSAFRKMCAGIQHGRAMRLRRIGKGVAAHPRRIPRRDGPHGIEPVQTRRTVAAGASPEGLTSGAHHPAVLVLLTRCG